jgi:hypothetical protein
VKLNGVVQNIGICKVGDGEVEEVHACYNVGFDHKFYCLPGEIGIDVWYNSTNPKMPGDGSAVVCVEDGGEGKNANEKDEFRIFVLDGPYAGYFNKGYVQGNIQEHDCPWIDGYDNDLDGLSDLQGPGCNGPEGVNGEETTL